MPDVKINASRLNRSLVELGRIGETPKGCNALLFLRPMWPAVNTPSL